MDAPRARWRLTGLKLRKVDRVAQGDNPAARVLLAKASTRKQATNNDRQALLTSAGRDRYRTGDNGHLWVEDWTDQWVVFQVREDDGNERLLQVAYTINGTDVAFGTETEVVRETRFVTKQGFPAKSGNVGAHKEARMADIDLAALPEDVRTAFEGLQTQLAEKDTALAAASGADTAAKLAAAEAELATAKTTIAQFNAEKAEFEKAVGARPAIRREDLPDDVRKALDAADAALAEKDALATRVAKMEREAARTALVAKAAVEYPSLNATADEIADVLLEASEKLDEATSKRLQALLKAANAQIDTAALFKEVGRAAGNPDDRAAFDAEVAKYAADHPTVGATDAKAAVAKARPDLVQALNG